LEDFFLFFIFIFPKMQGWEVRDRDYPRRLRKWAAATFMEKSLHVIRGTHGSEY
jgi:hypothetical protein